DPTSVDPWPRGVTMHRRPKRLVWLAGLGGFFVMAAAVEAQVRQAPAQANGTPTPTITAITPPGARIGATMEWGIKGSDLKEIARWLISGGGVEVASFEPKSETEAVVKVKVDPDAAPGVRELRVVGPLGLSNLALVRIDSLPQAAEKEPND